MGLSRRQFIGGALVAGAGIWGLQRLLQTQGVPKAGWMAKGYGALRPDPAGLLDLPDGFTYKIISRQGQVMDDGLLTPGRPDGMAAFAGPQGKVFIIRNHELDHKNVAVGPFGSSNEMLPTLDYKRLLYDAGKGKVPSLGGTTTLLYNPKTGQVDLQYLSLAGTRRNCAGGLTPWGTWISCEENTKTAGGLFEEDHGYPFEVTPYDTVRLDIPKPIKPMGRFNREAMAVHPASGVVYQTEDRSDSLMYRYVPKVPGKLLAGGRVQALSILGQPHADLRNWGKAATVKVGQSLQVKWVDLDNVQAPEDDLRIRGFKDHGASLFARTEGVWYGGGKIWFVCTQGGDAKMGQIWTYAPSPNEGRSQEDTVPGTLTLFAEPNDRSVMEMGDNITVTPWGDLMLCEDGPEDDYLLGVTPEGTFFKMAHNANSKGEFTGVCFTPDGKTMFVNMQKEGLTFAITGPWDSRKA